MGQGRELRDNQTEWDLHEAAGELIPMEFTGEIQPSIFGIEENKAQGMVSGLRTVFAEREILKDAYIDVIELPINTENLPTFKELRLKLVKNRTSIEKWHKENKAFYLAGGRFVDAIKNKEVLEGQEMESKLMEAEKFFERQQAEITAKLNAERIALVEPYLESVVGLDLTTMDEYIFDAFLEGSKKKFNDKIEAERIAEEKRIEEAKAEAERLEAQRLENVKLKAEAEAQAVKDAETLKELREQHHARLALESELQSFVDAELTAENERASKELQDKKDAEKLAKAPIKKQLGIWVECFEIPLPLNCNSTSIEIQNKFEAFKKWAKLEIEKL